MKIPPSLKVGGHLYQVLMPYTFVDRSDLSGQSCHSTLQLKISVVNQGGERRSRSQIEETFLHELIHCVDVVYNSSGLSEDAVTRLSEGLFQVLSDNGLLAEEQEKGMPDWTMAGAP